MHITTHPGWENSQKSIKVHNNEEIIQNSPLHEYRAQNIQGYPQRMRLHRRLYRMYTVCFLIFMIPCNCKLVYLLFKLLNMYVKDSIQGIRLNLTLESSYLKSFRSSLQSLMLLLLFLLLQPIIRSLDLFFFIKSKETCSLLWFVPEIVWGQVGVGLEGQLNIWFVSCGIPWQFGQIF